MNGPRQFVVNKSFWLPSYPYLSPSSNEHRYPCQDCGKGYTDPAARIRHRKAVHGYQPYHTPQYYARRARGKATLKKGDQKPANVLPPQPATQSASSSSSSSTSSAESPGHFLANVTYHDEVWKLLLNVPQRDGPGENTSQDAQISTPVAAAPARDTPSPLRSDSDLSLPPPPPPNVGQQQPTATQTGDGARYQWEQSQTLAQSWAAYPGATSFPTSSWQSATYPAGTSFQSLPPFSFTNAAVPSSSSFDSPATSTSTASSSSYMISPDYIQTPTPLDALNWNPAISAPMTQTEFFTGEPNRAFKTEDFA